jgi:hypothetical protein
MIKFSWKKINNKFGWNAISVLQYFYLKQNINSVFMRMRYVPNKVKAEAAKEYFKGPCFLVNIDDALKHASSPNHLYIYLELASKRNIFDYQMRGILYLPMAMVPECLMALVETNPMLEVKDDKLYFKYEQE